MKLCRDYNQRKDGHRNNHHAYICSTYSRGGKNTCTPHRTLELILVELVKEDIQKQAQRIRFNEDAVVKELLRRKNAAEASNRTAIEQELSTVNTRLAELKRLTQNIYEEMVAGQIPHEVLLELMDKYQAEKQEKTEQAERLSEQLEMVIENERGIHEWIALIKGFAEVQTLDRDLLLRLIDKIVIGQKTCIDGVEQKTIAICYNFVGALD